MFTVSCRVCAAMLPFPTAVLAYNWCVCGLHPACPSRRGCRRPFSRNGAICPHCFTLHSLITCVSDNKNHHVLSPHCTQGPKIKHSARTSSFIPPCSPRTSRDPKGQRNKGTCPTLRVVISAEDLSTWFLLPSQTLLPASAGSGSIPVPGGHRSAPVTPAALALDTSQSGILPSGPPWAWLPPRPPVPEARPWGSGRQHRVPIHGGHGLRFCATWSSV